MYYVDNYVDKSGVMHGLRISFVDKVWINKNNCMQCPVVLCGFICSIVLNCVDLCCILQCGFWWF